MPTMRVTERDVETSDGRVLHAYDTGGGDVTVVWHHGTPNIGLPPEPLFDDSARLGIRWVSYDRPGYGGSTPNPGRDVASAASDTAAVADALGVERFAVMGHSGGGPHALACAALLGDRVLRVVSGAGLAPFDAEGLDWFAGMGESSAASLRAAAAGREAKERFEAEAEGEPDFVEADWAALRGPWSWFGQVVAPAMAGGPAPLIDDDLAYVSPWGFDPQAITAPTLFVHGGSDRMVPCGHGEWLAGRVAGSELRVVPGEGHVSILGVAGVPALEWVSGSS
jgi:pimeloyl-ACP methyl ester carboxylesterase